MKSIQIILILIGTSWASAGLAQDKVIEDTLIVKGICGMCKERIENAAYGKGVKFVSWDQATDKLSLAFRSDKTSIAEIEQRVLKAGHSTSEHNASAENYAKLPDCCRYEEVPKH